MADTRPVLRANRLTTRASTSLARMTRLKRARAPCTALSNLLAFPDDILLELVANLEFSRLYTTLLALCAVCRQTRALYSDTKILNALCTKHCTSWGLSTMPIGSVLLPLRRLHIGAQRWSYGFKSLFEVAPDECGASRPQYLPSFCTAHQAQCRIRASQIS